MRYEHVIWDWNGTLFDDASLCVEIMNGMLAKRGLEQLDEQRYRQVFTFPVRDYYDRLGFDLEREPFEKLAVEFHDSYLARWRESSLRPDALAVIDGLNHRGVTQTILSAAEQRMLDACAAHFEVADRMTAVVGIDDFNAVSKLEHGHGLLKQLDTVPERVLFVGDTVHDHEVATAMSVDSVLVRGGHASPAKLEKLGVPVFDSLAALLEWCE